MEKKKLKEYKQKHEKKNKKNMLPKTKKILGISHLKNGQIQEIFIRTINKLYKENPSLQKILQIL